MNDIVPKKDIPTHTHDDYDEDLDLVRKTLRTALMAGEEGIELANRVADESEHPRAIEVLGNLIKLQAENAGRLLDMHKTHKDINKNEAGKESDRPSVTQNNLYISDTSDFLKQLEEHDKKPVIDGDIVDE